MISGSVAVHPSKPLALPFPPLWQSLEVDLQGSALMLQICGPRASAVRRRVWAGVWAWRIAMPLYEVSADRLSPVAVEKFAALDMYEREDLQRLLRENISPLGDDLLVIAEEFGQWEDARRRVDLLAIDTTGQLVVIELKRSETGGHMDLQAIRYAAMVSTMSFADVVATYQALTATHHPGDDCWMYNKSSRYPRPPTTRCGYDARRPNGNGHAAARPTAAI
jgi:hypothetical protein